MIMIVIMIVIIVITITIIIIHPKPRFYISKHMMFHMNARLRIYPTSGAIYAKVYVMQLWEYPGIS